MYCFPTIRVGELDCHSKRMKFHYLVVKVGKKNDFSSQKWDCFLRICLYVSVELVRRGRKLIIIPKINDDETPRKSRSSKLVNFYGGFFVSSMLHDRGSLVRLIFRCFSFE